MTLHDLVAENAARFATRTALIDPESGERVAYAEIPDRVARLAGGLRAAGVGSGDCVASLSMNSCAVIEALLATATVGAVLSPLSWRQSDDELAWTLRHANAAFTLYEPEWAHLAPAASASYTDLAGLRSAPPVEDADPSEDDAALRLFTAAFSGKPLAADLSQRALVTAALQLAAQYQIGHDEVFLNSGPMFHIGLWIFTLAVFLMGGTNVVPRKYDAEQAAALVDRERITWAFLVPPMGSSLLDAAEAGGYDLSSIRKGIAHEARERWLASTSAVPVTDVMPYGQTEVSGLATYQVSAADGPSAFGTTLPLVRLAVVGPDDIEVPHGEVGEIVMRGPTVMRGYAGDDAANADRFRAGWYHTHDLGKRLLDGGVQFIGPMTELIKSGAENVYPAEVEAALRRHTSVAGVCVIGVPDATWGATVKAVVQLREGAAVESGELIEFCKSQIASYKKPRHVVFVDQLPMTGHTVDRERVHALHGAASDRVAAQVSES